MNITSELEIIAKTDIIDKENQMNQSGHKIFKESVFRNLES